MALHQDITTNETGKILIGTNDPSGTDVGGVLVAGDGEIDNVELTILIGLAGDGFIVHSWFSSKENMQYINL